MCITYPKHPLPLDSEPSTSATIGPLDPGRQTGNIPYRMLLRSPAKINLYLRVGKPRPDGFHDLVSWFCSLGLCDELDFIPEPSDEVTMSCNDLRVPLDSRNLILRAAALLRPHAKLGHGAHIHLEKRIPMGGGMGGGSANAATALCGLAMMWGCELPAGELDRLAAQLGSDVPFFLHLPSAICRGRGERITPISSPVARWVLLILPAIEMPTPAVYRRFDEMGLGTDLADIEHLLPSPKSPTPSLLNELVNDLEAPAFAIAPELSQLRSRCEDLLRRPVRMSGSGSTLFTLYDGAEDAFEAARMIGGLAVKAMACETAILA